MNSTPMESQNEYWLVVWLPWILCSRLEHEFWIFPYIGSNHPNWLSYFSEGFKPPTRIDWIDPVNKPRVSGCSNVMLGDHPWLPGRLGNKKTPCYRRSSRVPAGPGKPNNGHRLEPCLEIWHQNFHKLGFAKQVRVLFWILKLICVKWRQKSRA